VIRPNPQGDYPNIDKTAYIDLSAVIIGKVKIGKNVFVAPGAVIRADEPESSISISDNCNIQDRAVIHALGNSSVIIGENTSLSHGCIVHGPCRIGKGCFIGFGSVVFKSALADKVFVGHLAVVEGAVIPERRCAPSGTVIKHKIKTKALKMISREQERFIQQVVDANLRLNAAAVKQYAKKSITK